MTANSESKPASGPEQGDTNPFGVPAYRPRKKKPILIGAAVVLVSLIIFLLLKPISRTDNSQSPAGLAESDQTADPEKPEAVSRGRIWIQLRLNELSALEALALQEKQQLVSEFGKWPGRSGINGGNWDFLHPSADQLAELQRQAREGDEKTSAYLYQLDSYRFLRNRISGLEAELGLPYLVAPGQTHFQIALDYLTSRIGKSAAEARRILKDTRLHEPLVPGFKVWNYWIEESFLTFVSMGAAQIHPEAARQKAMEKQIMEKKQTLDRMHALYLLVGSFKDLQQRRILQGGFLRSLRLGQVDPGEFSLVLDLGRQRIITIRAASLQLEEISRVELFPREFSLDRDYALQFDAEKKQVRLDFFNTEVFRGRRVVVALD